MDVPQRWASASPATAALEVRDLVKSIRFYEQALGLELAQFIKEKDVDVFVGGVKERPIAYKLGVGFCDHNHERKIALEGFIGMYNLAKEIHASVMSPVWKFMPRRAAGRVTCTTKEAVNG